MFSKLNLFLIAFGTAILLQLGRADNFITIGTFADCEGKDSGNYTNVLVQGHDAACSQASVGVDLSVFIQNGPKGEKTIIGTQLLASSRYPAGAEVITEKLYLLTSGSLAGKFGFVRSKHLVRNYLKKCSSVLGYSFIIIKISQFLISDRLDPNVLISPTGAFEAFKKGCTTVCNGSYWGV